MIKDIIIFGRGKYFKSKLENLKSRYHIVGILDNAVKEKEFDSELSCAVYNPKQWSCLMECHIIIMSIYFIDIWRQLIEMGVPCQRIKFGQTILPFYDDYERLMFSNEEWIEATGKELLYDPQGRRMIFQTQKEYDEIKRKIFLESHLEIKCWNQLGTQPIDKNFGIGRGKAADRVYIEEFIKKYRNNIRGTVMEVQDSRYIKQFGENRVKKEVILRVDGGEGKNIIKGNFATGEGLDENSVDCLICTQTLQYIYDLKSTAKNIYKLLKKDGTVLVTVPGIKSLSAYHDEKWGEYWSFTRKSLYRMFAEEFGEKNVIVETYGNVKIAMAYLYGLCAEELEEKDFSYNDEHCPFIIAAYIRKK